MENEMKRRVFLTGIVGTLIGTPIAVRLLSKKSGPAEPIAFERELRKYRNRLAVPVTPTNGDSPFSLALVPPVGTEWKYVFFSPSFLPEDMSQATGDEPDAFLAREGVLYVDRMNSGQVVITGGDTVFNIFSPLGTEEKEKQKASILVKENTLCPAKAKGSSGPVDLQLPHLLALGLPNREASVGMKWTSTTGRIKPFTGFSTDYEIVGFAEVAGRKTVNIAFFGKIPNIVGLPGVSREKAEPDAISSSTHRGNAWFDLETGFLVRQDAEMETVNSGIKGFKRNNGSEILPVKARFTIQLFLG